MAEVKKVPGSVHLTAYYKGTWTQQITLEDSNGDPYSIAGATATFIIYELNGTAALTLSTGSGITHTGAGGVITVTATNAQIVGLATQDYLYELILTLADTTVMPVLDGTFSITEDGAAAASTADISVTIGGGAITLTLPIGIQGPVAGRTGGVLITPTSGSTAATGGLFPRNGRNGWAYPSGRWGQLFNVRLRRNNHTGPPRARGRVCRHAFNTNHNRLRRNRQQYGCRAGNRCK